MEVLFPHEKMRPVQEELVKEVYDAIENKKDLIAHAPTGLGKTAASLAPALMQAIKKGLTVFFLTSRHTQHKIAVETLKQIKAKHNVDFTVVDLIGKKWMCPVEGTDELFSHEFTEYCKSVREERKCEYYVNVKKTSGTETVKAKVAMDELKKLGPTHCEEMVGYCSEKKLCPYEVLSLMAKKAKVIISDYYYIFHPSIRKNFFNKAEIELSKTVIIVDEAHNLPERIREVMSIKMSNLAIRNAIKEAKRYGYSESFIYLDGIKRVYEEYLTKLKTVEKVQQQRVDELLVLKEDFVEKINSIANYDEIITQLEFDGDKQKEEKKRSYMGGIALFLENWLGPDQSYARILSKKLIKTGMMTTISYKCLDPSITTKKVMEDAYCTILMSGTLTPTSMYADLLGMKNVTEKKFDSPFPKENKLSLVIPETTTKFTERGPQMYEKIATKIAEVTNLVPGNSAVFFPSYKLMEEIGAYYQIKGRKTIMTERPEMSKKEKEELLEKFASYKKVGSVLLGVAAGSFSQGVDFPGDLLKSVIVVGLPLQKPDLETKELIDYYQAKYGRGWDYGYVFPAITKCMQSAGRCIRSEEDKGVIVFLDKRFAWGNYMRCFPPGMKVTSLYEQQIKEFFE